MKGYTKNENIQRRVKAIGKQGRFEMDIRTPLVPPQWNDVIYYGDGDLVSYGGAIWIYKHAIMDGVHVQSFSNEIPSDTSAAWLRMSPKRTEMELLQGKYNRLREAIGKCVFDFQMLQIILEEDSDE